MNTEYRTTAQFETIADLFYNGQWTEAIQRCVDYGFFAQDLVEHYVNQEDSGTLYIPATALAILAEGAAEIRATLPVEAQLQTI
jgi:hypothetical protein